MQMRAVGYNETIDKLQISPYLPDFVADGILKVDFAHLHKIGVKHLMMDLDQTLRQAYSRELDAEITDFFTSVMKKYRFSSINIVSNNNRNLVRYAKPLGARVFQPFWHKGILVRKPSARFYQRVLDELNINPREAVMIGDKVRPDVAGANRVGIYTVLVRKRGREYWFDHLLLARWREYRTLGDAIQIKSRHIQSTPEYIRSALKDIGIRVTSIIGPAHLPSGALLFVAKDKRRRLSIKVLTRWQGASNWLQRLQRYFRPSWNGEETPHFGTKHIVEHEAFIAALAERAGVQTPHIVGTIDLGDYRFALVTQFISNEAIDVIARHHVTDKLLVSIWKNANLLHTAGIAHGECHIGNFLIDTKNSPWLVNYDYATNGAGEAAMTRDRVELLVSMALVVGVDKAVTVACTALSHAKLREVRDALKPSNLSGRTRTNLKYHSDPSLLQQLGNKLAATIK